MSTTKKKNLSVVYAESTQFRSNVEAGTQIASIVDDKEDVKTGDVVELATKAAGSKVLDVFGEKKVSSFQDIEISKRGNAERAVDVKIDGKTATYGQIVDLAVGSGFKDVHELFDTYKTLPFKGKIVHWTSKKF